ncbi:MAG: hypothetical protein A2V88_07110 [Elusimicrobia bacterium RBG_16_66_12]|nr:MAG: hypothetical protein A2V88_07110 [Elusimicrobia bacterium RBG_16_66_12]
MGPAFLLPLSGDETFHLFLSGLLKHGGRLFDQYWVDDKPGGMQLIYYIFTPFRDGLSNFYAIKLFTAAYQLLTSFAFYFLCKHCFAPNGRIAKALLLIFILVYANPMVEGQFSNADNLVVLWIILAAYFFLGRWHMLSALSVGICFCLKQNTALEILPSSLTIIAQGFAQGAETVGRRLVRAGLTVSKQFLVFLVPVGLIWLCTVHAGTSENFLALAFIKRIHSHLLHKDYGAAARYGIPIFKQSGILWLGLLGFILDWPRRRWAESEPRASAGGFDGYLLIWAACALISVWVGGYFFPHYFIELVPVLVICATVFLLKINGAAFHLLIATAIAASQRFGVVGNGVAALACCAAAAVEHRRQVDRNIWRPLMVLSCLLLTLNQNPLAAALSIVKARNPLMFYSQDDRDMLQAARYLKETGSDRVFVYDYTPQIYCLSGIVPRFRYGFKSQYINYAVLIKENLNYPNDDSLFSARREELAARMRGGDFQYVAVNYNTVRLDEGPQMRPIIAALDGFYVRAIFGNVWIYKRGAAPAAAGGRRFRVSRAISDEKADVINIIVERSSLVPESTMDLACGAMTWHYPENGIIYPMKAAQDANRLEIRANRRGFAGGNCVLDLNSVLETRSFKTVNVAGIPKKSG